MNWLKKSGVMFLKNLIVWLNIGNLMIIKI